MSGSGRQALSNVRECSEVNPRCPGVFRRPSRMVGRPSQMSGSGWGPSRMSGSGREAHPDVRVWSGVPPGYPGVVGRHSQMSEKGR